jgi:hypothetical protein
MKRNVFYTVLLFYALTYSIRFAFERTQKKIMIYIIYTDISFFLFLSVHATILIQVFYRATTKKKFFHDEQRVVKTEILKSILLC